MDPASRTRLQFLGPRLHPIGKWVFGFCYLIGWVLVIAIGVTRGFPLWLRLAGFAVYGIVFLAVSIRFTYLHYNRRRRHELLRRGPCGFRRWYLDDYDREPER